MRERDPRSRLAAASDAELEAALRDLAGALDWPEPAPGPDLATRVRVVLAQRAVRRRPWWGRLGRATLLAGAALLLLVALAVAAAIGVPGIRIVFLPGAAPSVSAPPSASGLPASPSGASASPSAGPPGASLDLGEPTSLAEAGARAGVTPLVPADPSVGSPDAVYLAERRLTLAWAPRATLPALDGAPGTGLLLTEFRGHVEDVYYEKQVFGETTVERVSVAGAPGWWLAGAPHFFFYVDEGGRTVNESRRLVGRVLVWERDGVTYRLESPFDRDATIRLAGSLAPAR